MAIKRNKDKTANSWEGKEYSIKVNNAKFFNDNAISFSLTVNDVVVNGCWYRSGVKDGKEWEILSLPQYKGSDGKYYNVVFFPINSYKDQIINEIEGLL